MRHSQVMCRALDARILSIPVITGSKWKGNMKWTAIKALTVIAAVGVAVGGCATRDSVEQAQSAADQANGHALAAQNRADQAYDTASNALSTGNTALSTGRNAISAAQMANQKADLAITDIANAKKRIAYLEYKLLPHYRRKLRHRYHHTAKKTAQKSNDS